MAGNSSGSRGPSPVRSAGVEQQLQQQQQEHQQQQQQQQPGVEESEPRATCAGETSQRTVSSQGGSARSSDRGDRGDGAVAEPERLLCPITQILFQDPCFVPESGNTYERSAIEQYWASSSLPRDPLTNVALAGTSLHVNWGVRREVQQFLDDHPGYIPQGWRDRRVPGPVVAKRSAGRTGSFMLMPWLPVVVLLVAVAVVLRRAALEAGFRPPWSSSLGHELGLGEDAVLQPPKGSQIQAWEQEARFMVRIPPRGFSTESLGQLIFAVFWLGFIGVWTTGAIAGGAPPLFAAFSLPFWGVGLMMILSVVKDPLVSQVLDLHSSEPPLSQGQYLITTEIFGRAYSEEVGLTADLQRLPVSVCDGSSCQLVFEDGAQELVFGASLRPTETRWIQRQLQRHLVGSDGSHVRFEGQLRETEVTHSGVSAGGFHVAGGIGPGFGFVIR